MIGRLLLLLVLVVASSGAAWADRLDLIRLRGSLIVGVKSDYPPFGMYDQSGGLIGIEADLAADLASRLGVGLELVGVTTANRLQRLEEGRVDLIIATLGDTAQRRSIATLVEPGYFASGANVMLRPDASGIGAWSDLKGQPVCATQGALFNAAIAQRHLMELRTFTNNRDVKLALKDGRCVGWLYDDIAILGQMTQPGWSRYRMPLPLAVPTPWAIALPRDEAGGRLERIVGDTIADWHRSGFLIETTERWDLPATDFLIAMQERWSAKDERGEFVCRREPDGEWVAECRAEDRLTAADVEGVQKLEIAIRERLGLNLSFLSSPYQQRLLLEGLLVTLGLVALSIVGSLVVGVLGAALLAARVPVVPTVTAAAAAFWRMTPPLLQIYLLFFGVSQLLAARTGLRLDGFVVAAFCFSFYAGAANATAIAQARQTLGPAAHGAGGWRSALGRAWTPVMSSCVNIAKATGMASTIAVPELVYASTSIVSDSGNSGVMMTLLLLAYFLVVLGVFWAFERIGRRFAQA